MLTIEQVKKEILEKFSDEIEGIILFGSYVTGTPDEFSDLDFVVVTRDVDSVPLVEMFVNIGGGYNPDVVSKEEFERMVRNGDIFYRYEVLGKGRIVYERDSSISNLLAEQPEFNELCNLYSKRMKQEKNYIHYFFANGIDRLKWMFNHLACLFLAKEGIYPQGLNELYNEMEKDEMLSEYLDDFKEIARIAKDIKHGGIDYSFSEIDRIYERLCELERAVVE
jgi:predicted nucleotidyltransferase